MSLLLFVLSRAITKEMSLQLLHTYVDSIDGVRTLGIYVAQLHERSIFDLLAVGKG
jgi:hypothetical protein